MINIDHSPSKLVQSVVIAASIEREPDNTPLWEIEAGILIHTVRGHTCACQCINNSEVAIEISLTNESKKWRDSIALPYIPTATSRKAHHFS